MSKATEVTDQSFSDEVLSSDKPVLVDFWAPWCGPCRAVAPAVDQVAQAFDGNAKVVKVNVDENQETAAQFGVRSIPTFLVFSEGKPVKQLIGAHPAAHFEEVLQEVIDGEAVAA